MEFKLIIFWAALTLVLYMVTKVSYNLSNTSYNWKYYKQETWIGSAYLCVLTLGGTGVAGYLVIRVAKWWFNL